MSYKSEIDFSKVRPVTEMVGEDEEETELLKAHLSEAANYVKGQKWCSGIVESYFGIGIGGVVAVFLFKIHPSAPEVDDYVWAVVGDIPPLYLTVEDCPNPACALDGYIGALEQWADAAIEQKDVSGLPPVSAPPSVENGRSLKKRLQFLDREVLSQYRGDLV